MKKALLVLYFPLCFVAARAQNIHRCGTDEAVYAREFTNPGYQHAVDQTFEQVKHLVSQKDITDENEILRIPVVVHIVYNTPEENISSDMVYTQIARLNRDYRRLNEDTADTRSVFKPIAADAGIEFYLAGTDPDGNPSGGITRTQTDRTDFTPDFFGGGLDDVKQSSLGGVDAWDTDKYLNIWVCDLLGSGGFFSILGFAYPPATAPNWPANSAATDPAFEGVVVHYEVFGDGNPLAVGQMSVSDKGRTAVHEVGHYLGLRHIWGDALFGDGCAEDDGIDDTPNASANAQQQCNFSNNTCTDSPVDFPDMIENYMDYARDECMNLFTQGQINIMREMLTTARSGLLDGSVEPSGVGSSILDYDVSMYPNPSSGMVQLQFASDLELRTVAVTDVKGSVVFQNTVSTAGGLVSIDLDLPAGSYVLRAEFDEGTVFKKLMIQ